jgi:hypothetical protein
MTQWRIPKLRGSHGAKVRGSFGSETALLTITDHSIEADGRCPMKFINHAEELEANARCQVCESRWGRVIRVFSSEAISGGEEITARYK